jgi:hypothetical protein
MLISERLPRLRSAKRTRPRLPFPAAPHLRIAQLTPRALFDAVEGFAFECWSAIEAYQPQVLVGSAVELRMLAARVQEGALDLTSVDHAIFALGECGQSALADTTRVVLWQAFGVPIYELLMSAQGMLLASECEAHEGWHVEPGARFAAINDEIVLLTGGKSATPTGLTGRLEVNRCPCGRAGVRILPAEQQSGPGSSRTLAATA